eukprot:3097699-Pyramimonas_sp.AAC.1
MQTESRDFSAVAADYRSKVAELKKEAKEAKGTGQGSREESRRGGRGDVTPASGTRPTNARGVCGD